MKSIYKTLREMSRDKTLIEYADHVIQWNEVAAKAKGHVYTPLNKQWEFVEEEFEETMKALREGDKVEVVDGACDLFVVTSYAYFLKNVQGVGYSRSSLEKACEYDAQEVFSPLCLEKAIYDVPNEYKALKQVIALLYRLDINLSYNLGEVLDSNDSKYPTMEQLRSAHGDLSGRHTDEEHLDAACDLIEKLNKGRYSGVYAKNIDDKYVFFDAGGKIMKPVTFRKPKIIV